MNNHATTLTSMLAHFHYVGAGKVAKQPFHIVSAVFQAQD